MSAEPIRDMLDRGDYAGIICVAMKARSAAEQGRFCQCVEPTLVGRDLMCTRCFLENEGQRDKLTALMRGPHPFEQASRVRMPMCQVCSGWQDDPRHEAPTGDTP